MESKPCSWNTLSEERPSHFRVWVDMLRMAGLHLQFLSLRLSKEPGLYRQMSLRSQEEIGESRGDGLVSVSNGKIQILT